MDSRRLSSIEMFAFDVPQSVHCDAGPSVNCRYGILRLACRGEQSWGACILSTQGKGFDLIKWGFFLRGIRGRRLDEALDIVRSQGQEWELNQLEVVQTALLDLRAKLQGKFITAHIQPERLHRAVAGGDLRAGRLYYKPSKALSNGLQQKRSWPEMDTAELMDKSIAYFSIL